MQCPRCNEANPQQARFCMSCGAGLLNRCAKCGTELPATARFCFGCGQAVATAGAPTRFPSAEDHPPSHFAERMRPFTSALEGERKHVTVLFADIKSSMEFMVDRDPEEARTILDPVLEHMIEAVHRYEGTVNQVMGDGIMALFGAPLAQEDHAVRGCYAALRMQDSVKRYATTVLESHGVAVRVRIGLNSGDVVVRSIGSDVQMDYSAIGQTTHLAARMEQMAEPGSVLATADTVRLAEGYIEAKSLGPVDVRGLDAPVEIFAVTAHGLARKPLDVSVARGLTGFVGRQAELTELARAVETASQGRGQVVGVVGDPGVGKSRLFHELTRADRMPGWRVLQAGAASYGKGVAYRPIIDLLRAYFELRDGAGAADVRERITNTVLTLDTDLDPIVPALFGLLDVPADAGWESLEPRHRRERIMDALCRLFLRASHEQPLCLVLEDLHWIDSETQLFLDRLVESLPASRVLLLVNYRPEYRHDWGTKTYYVRLRIDPLTRGMADEFLAGLLGDHPSLAPLKDVLYERTKGNPFFLEESVRALAETGALAGQRGDYRLERPVQDIVIAPTVQSVLAARIDRLAPADKSLLQSAAVIGDSVPVSLLAAIAEMPGSELRAGLERLRAAELLYDVTLFPEPAYVFRHGLTRLVAYESLLRTRRARLHKRVVDAIERLYPDSLGERVEQLAHHARRGETWDRAVRYLSQAAAKAFAHSANREAVTWFEDALNAIDRLPRTAALSAQAVELHLGLRNALTLLGEHEGALAHLRDAQAMAEQLGDRRNLGRALSFEVNSLLLLGDHERAVDVGQRARAVAAELDDVRLRIVTDIYIGRARLFLGDFARAIGIFIDVTATLTGELAHDHLGVPILPSVFARSHLIECLSEVGRFDEAARHAADAIALADTVKHPDTALWAYHGEGLLHLARGDIDRATEALGHAYALCRAHDMPAYSPRFSAELGLAWALAGRADEAVEMVQTAAAEAEARRQTTSYSQVLGLLARISLLAGRLGEAEAAANDALGRFRRQRERAHEAHALHVLADIGAEQASCDGAAIEARYAEATALAQELGMRPLVARCGVGLARHLERTGCGARAREVFASASALLRELGMTEELARAETRLGIAG
jgi:class 3 adenylate cyclase/tetratricopeptide (TPR) repeat protein